MLHKNFQITVLTGKLFAAIAFIITSTLLSSCSTPESQKPEVPTQPQKPQSLNNPSNQQPNQQLQQSNQANNGTKNDKDDDKDDDKDSSKDDKD